MKKLLLLIFLIATVSLKSQQKIAFSFGETPQTLMLNPGSEINYKSHYGIPIVSNFQLTIGKYWISNG